VKVKTLLILVIAMLATYVVLVALAELPPYGMPGNPSHNQVAQRYIENAWEDTGVLNMITAVVLDYRAYDTMFETIVLFTAVLAVIITLKTTDGKGGGK
jgi:multisubunit Na+/H+ antiporter MnhB subunit